MISLPDGINILKYLLLHTSHYFLSVHFFVRVSHITFFNKCTKIPFSLHMHAKPSFAHRLQAAKMASSRTRAQNTDPRAQKNGPWV